MHPHQTLSAIFHHAVSAVHPVQLMRNSVQVSGRTITVCGSSHTLDAGGRIWVIGAGKASAAMAQELEHLLGGHFPLQGFIVTKYGHALPLQHLAWLEAGHPVPDANSVAASVKILEIAHTATAADMVIFLLSGGASSLMADFPVNSSLEEVQELFGLLLASGADIHEMNTVRKHISMIKGGWLAKSIYPAPLYTIILSDVPGDDLSIIGSGPTVPDPSTFADTMAVLQQYRLTEKIPLPIRNYLQEAQEGLFPETPKPGDPDFSRVVNCLAGTNRIALEAAAGKARELGYHPHIFSSQTTGNAPTVAEMVVQEAISWSGPLPACLLWGGETTVQVSGDGTGGRNQHLALAAAIALAGQENITLLSAGTDGTDGPTDAAGAIVDGYTVINAEKLSLQANTFLQRHDSATFFSKAGGQMITGPTQTNVMDLIIVLKV
ncbi:glycerate kinase [Chitinophaga sp. Mgbs1]|uniref:Glycerate kinase n=1 Tax=Chitinophaga solisilvae TaxID=1233460 RepID=A0A433WFL9_9BACT|nr:glycerate kinase [Chitinophaga solisilvae]